jgi:hypothetical protein
MFYVPCSSEAAYQAAPVWSTFNYGTCIVSSLNDVDDMAEFSLFPNPAKDKLFIEGGNFDKVVLYNVLGKEVLTSNKKEIDISNLPKGVYNVTIIADGKTIGTKKIVKQ